MEYQYIVNPITNRKCSIYSRNGQNILHKYIIQHGGACSICGADKVTKATCPYNPENVYRKDKLIAQGKHNTTLKGVHDTLTKEATPKTPTPKTPTPKTPTPKTPTPKLSEKFDKLTVIKPDIKTMWEKVDTCFYKLQVSSEFNKVCAFDFDDTIVKLRTSEPMHNVIDTLNELIKTQHNIVIFSNQKGIEKGHTTHQIIQSYMDITASLINGPISFFYSIEDDNYRKPMKGMYELFNTLVPKQHFDYYCGDAAGRPNDFSISDLYFANNINIPFKIPEEVFLNDKSQNSFIAKNYKKSIQKDLYKADIWINSTLQNPRNIVPISNIPSFNFNDTDKYLIFMIGPQASGKSTITSYLNHNYDFKIINGDILGHTMRAQTRKFTEYYNNPSTKGIIIDNTNPAKSTRSEWMTKNKKKWKVVLIFIDIPKDVCFHSIKYRMFHGGTKIPSIAVNIYYKKLEKPSELEGSIIKLNGVIPKYDYNHNLRFIWR